MAVRIVCDTTSYIPRRLIEEYAIEEVPLSVVWGDNSKQENEITDLDSFYDDLRSMNNLPTTSQPSIGQFLNVYRPIIESGDDFVSLHFSSGISGTFQSSYGATRQLEREGVDSSRMYAIDTGSACGGFGLILLAAASKARGGGTVEDVVAAARAMADGLHFWFAIDTLEYLRRGGRIGALASFVGTAMQIKPILTVNHEGIIPVERVRTQSRVIARLQDLAAENKVPGGEFIVQHVQAPERADAVIDVCRTRFGRQPLIEASEIGPVIGAHVGPGLIGVGVCPPDLIY